VRGRRRFLLALAGSLFAHLVLFAALSDISRPVPMRRPIQLTPFTVVELPPASAPAPAPPPGRATVRRPSAPAFAPGRPPPPGGGPALPGVPVPDAPRVEATLPGPSLDEMSSRAAEAVVRRRGPQRPVGTSVGEQVADLLLRGVGERTVAKEGFWDAYFSDLRRALLAAWPAARSLAWTGLRRTVRVRLVLDGEGLLRDFDLLGTSGDPVVDREVEESLHAARLPSPPALVLRGATELVTEWLFTVHPGLARKPGTPSFGPLSVGVTFDMVTLFDPHVDLTPLERNVTLAAFWTR
jgi:outer membrane biosynthesis protein TonB